MSVPVPFKLKPLTIAVTLACVAQAAQSQEMETTELGTVTVTAAGYEQNIKDAPATITVISAEELKKKSYSDITDALKNVPGVHIQGGSTEQSVMIRGMSADYTLFLIDGRPVQDNQAFGLNGGGAGAPVHFMPPIESIERIEIIRGPASSLYGSDAMGGVVNIITKRVVSKFSGALTTEYIKSGSGNDVTNDGFQTSVALNVPLIQDVLSMQLTGAFQNQDEADFVGGGDAAAADPEFKKRNVGAKLNWKVDERNTITLGASHTKQERWHNAGKSLAADDDDSYTKNERDNYFIQHEGRYGDLLWNSYLTYDSSENPTRRNATTGNGIKFDSWSANTQATAFLGKHTLTGGANYKNEKLEDGATNGVNIPGMVASTDVVEMERYQYSLFAEDEWQLIDDLALIFGARYDDNEAFGSQVSPKVYAVYQATDHLTLKGGMTTGYKAPSLRQSAPDFGGTSMGGVMIGNPDLKPETSRSYEVGASYENQRLGLSGSLTAYQTDFEDKITRTGRICPQNTVCTYKGTVYPAHQYGYTAYENVDEAELKGVEFTLDYRILPSLTYRHSYTYAKTEQKSGTNKGRPLNDIPEHMFNVGLDWDINSKWGTWVQANYRGKTSGRTVNASGSATNNVRYPSYTFYDLGLVYTATKDVKLKLGLYNAGNKKVAPEEGYAYVLDGRRFIASMSLNF
ncbi:TonB-dependent receptor domain-containing protein [Pseudothauera rhizosphaerae]|uniref:TonB-dependent receptor n=1 Tax=Pseudothauera rhizosphaerae TaxID=2565932 RepID=A0A4S4AQK2_9RHOO|nr:TonB-dependent receptor [Pseudothauera rhizosphaerae]THF60724.1 TonB-dependent receptor [Pseudothauera rhizosphaerae]